MAPIPKPVSLAAPPPSPGRSPVPSPDLAARPVFPVSALGPALSAAAVAAAHRIQAPVELIAHHLLALAAMPAQRLVSLRLPTGRIQPVSSYFLTIVASGEGRSAAERLCVDPVRFWERRFTAASGMVDEKGRRPERPTIAFEFTDDGAEEWGFKVTECEPAPVASAKPFEFDHVFLSPFRSGVNDRYDRYARFGRRGGLFAGVAADLLTPSRARRNEADSLSALWDGRVVVTGPAVAPRLSVHLVATPGEGFGLLRAPEVAESGLLGRLLTVQPASRIGARGFSEGDGEPPRELAALHAVLTALYAREASTETRILAMDADAKDAWFAFAREVEAAMGEGGAFQPIRPLAGHLAEHAARLAVIVAVVEDAALAEVSPAALDRGIALARYYAAEAVRLLDVRAAPPVEKDPVAALQAWLDRKYAGREISLREVYSCGPAAMRSPAVAQRSMRQLELLGVAERREPTVDRHGNGAPSWHIAAPREYLPHTAA